MSTTDATSTRAPAHRPSRRSNIVDGAVTVFARQGFSDSSINDIASEVGVVPTAVYYHFSGKNELFEAALTQVIDDLSSVVRSARPDDAPATVNELHAVIDAVWDWVEANPERSTFLYQQLSGSTPRAEVLRTQFEQVHTDRAFAYLEDGRGAGSSARAEQASQTLAVRLLIRLMMAIQVSRLDGGPLADRDSEAVRRATKKMAARIVSR